jgi:hypothetical protein
LIGILPSTFLYQGSNPPPPRANMSKRILPIVTFFSLGIKSATPSDHSVD